MAGAGSDVVETELRKVRDNEGAEEGPRGSPTAPLTPSRTSVGNTRCKQVKDVQISCFSKYAKRVASYS